MTITKTSSGNYTITMSPTDAATVDRAESLFGGTVLGELIQGWLDDRRKLFDEQDAVAIFTRATPAEKASIIARGAK